jgi:hypothetical protein
LLGVAEEEQDITLAAVVLVVLEQLQVYLCLRVQHTP